MKNSHRFIYLSLALFTAACSPYEDRITPADPGGTALDFTVTQTPGHDNEVTLESKTPGVISYWDYVYGFSNKQKVTVTIPFKGEFYVKYSAYADGGPKTDSVKVSISEKDKYYFSSPMWKLLTNAEAGKTWVWAVDIPGGACMGNGSGGAVKPEWWAVGSDYLKSVNAVNDEMTFDLDKNFNFTFSSNGKTTKGSFTLDTLNQTLKINGADISQGAKATYVVVKLNENELTLAQQGDGWRNIYMYKRKGFSF